MAQVPAQSPLQQRSAGILLHPTSLPGPGGCGTLGDDAYRFVDFLAAAGQQIWQILPIGPTHSDGSPYQSLSVHAGEPALISMVRLQQWGWLDRQIDLERRPRDQLIAMARRHFLDCATDGERDEWQQFLARQHHWLADYALFRVIRNLQQQRGWCEWPIPLRDRDPAALQQFAASAAEAIDTIRFEQFLFFRQWCQLKGYANRHGVRIFGDMPIFVAHDSADVWAHRSLFQLDAAGQPQVVAGVPPDYFSATGQRWGNPHYAWAQMAGDQFHWWQQRLAGQMELFDLVRIDHFRGFQAYWEIPASAATAIDGHWVEAPGAALFSELQQRFSPLPVVAEDLGTITPEVLALRDQFALPGMKILQFAFDSGSDNPYLPHNHEANSVVYTGTHDNDTTVGWYQGLSGEAQAHIQHYLGHPDESIPWSLIRCAYHSVAQLAMVPLQDVMGLDGAHRMNTPGTNSGNWHWRFAWSQLAPDSAARLRELAALYGRL